MPEHCLLVLLKFLALILFLYLCRSIRLPLEMPALTALSFTSICCHVEDEFISPEKDVVPDPYKLR